MLKFDGSVKDFIPLLNLHNDQEWQKKVENFLDLINVKDHILLDKKPDKIDEQKWNNDDLSIKNFLIDRIGDENIKRLVADFETTFEVWLKLKKFFKNKSSFDLFSKLDNFKIQTNSIESIQQFEQLFEETKKFMDLSSNYRSYKLLNSLPSRYNDFRSKIFCSDNLDYERIKIELFSYEKNKIDKMTTQNEELKDQNDNILKQHDTINESTINSQQNENTNSNAKRNLCTTDYDIYGKKIKIEYINNDNINEDNYLHYNETSNINQSSQSSTNQFQHSQASTNLFQLPQSSNQFHPLPSTSHVQDYQITSALVGPKSMNGNYFLCDYNCTFNLFNKEDFAKLNVNHLKKLYFIGILDDKIIKSINKFVNLIDLEIESTNINQKGIEHIKFDHNHLNYFLFMSEKQFKIELETKFLKNLATDLKLNNLNLDRDGIEFLNLLNDLVVKTEIKEIKKFKNLKTLQSNESITYELFNSIRILKGQLDHLNQIILYCLEIESEELLIDLIKYSDKESSPNISYQSIKLNNQVEINLNRNQLYNQLNNYKYLNDDVDSDHNVIDFNELIEILRELNVSLPNDFFDRYKSVNCIKFENLEVIENLEDIKRCLNFLDKMKNLIKMKIRITRKEEPLFEKLIAKLNDRLISLKININEESKLDINLIASLPKLSILKINKVLKNVELKLLTDRLKNLEFLKFKRQINNEDKIFKIIENDDLEGDPVFCLYIDNDDKEIFIDCDLKKVVKYVIDKYKK